MKKHWKKFSLGERSPKDISLIYVFNPFMTEADII